MSSLKVKDLCKTYIINKLQNNVLRNVSFEINESEMVAIMGPSGSGKSTLLYTVSGMDNLTAGRVDYFGKEMGNLKEYIKENKNRYFGKFVWGINVLRENLEHHKMKELKLEKEKKLLLLSISHDIQTPLNTIKLYAKAIAEEFYDTDEKKISAAKQIQEKSLEIEAFVKEIIKTSSEDILEIKVKNSEFYLKDLIDKVIVTYKEKCNLKMVDFIVEEYSNKLVKGDLDRTFEVIGNILENAFKYGDGKEIIVSFYEEDYCQLIKIFNSGETVSQNEFNHIFDSFYRGSNAKDKQGNGLGLYICKYIMEKMDGEVFTECEREGMSFTLVLKLM